MKIPKLDLRHIYVLYSFQYPWRAKIGISKDVDNRVRQIQGELTGALGYSVKIRRMAYFPAMFSETSEARLHRIFRRLHCNSMPRHAGHSEWFWCVNIVSGLLLYFVGRHFGLNVQPCHIALVALIPLPVDFALVAVLLAFAEYCIAAAVIYAGLMAVNLIMF